MLRAFLFVGLGSFLGGAARYLVGCWLPSPVVGGGATSCVATLAVNIIGSFLIGLLSAWLPQGVVSTGLRLFLITGFCGGFTTFSTFINDSFLLLRGHQLFLAVGYLALSVVLGFVALWAGWQLGIKN